MNRKLEDLTMYDVISVTEGDLAILHCMKEECNRNPESMPCKVHQAVSYTHLDVYKRQSSRYVLFRRMMRSWDREFASVFRKLFPGSG